MIQDAAITKYPFDVFKLLENLDIIVIAYSHMSKETRKACLGQSEDGFSALFDHGTYLRWQIYYNDSKSYERIRFTLMHELGHISMNHQNENEVSEAEANFFAKYILAPPIIIDQYIDEIDDFIGLSQVFQISQEMSYYQMAYYNTWSELWRKKESDIDNRILRLISDDL